MGKGLMDLAQRLGSPAAPPTGNWSHLAIHVDAFTKIKQLEVKGFELRKVTMVDGAHIAFFKDPDGQTIEIMEKGLSKGKFNTFTLKSLVD
jgi:catechol 2,3-dioxygenase-like lactoylglutathione lyase family enzyme